MSVELRVLVVKVPGALLRMISGSLVLVGRVPCPGAAHSWLPFTYRGILAAKRRLRRASRVLVRQGTWCTAWYDFRIPGSRRAYCLLSVHYWQPVAHRVTLACKKSLFERAGFS